MKTFAENLKNAHGEPLTVYVVEDDTSIREIETFALTSTGYAVKSFEEAAPFRKAMEEDLPDLILLDIMLPDSDGLTIVAELRADPRTAQIPIILVTAKTAEIDKVKGLDSGADDYMTKPFGIMELISRVKALLRRTNRVRGDNVLTAGEIVMDGDRHVVTSCGETCELTFKEYELLKYLMENEGIVTPREKILEKIWGTDFEGESRTLDMHIKTLRQKLGESGRMIRTVRNVGYILSED